MKGLFVNFYNPYKGRSFREQAETIVDLADQYLGKFPKVGIIYSANYSLPALRLPMLPSRKYAA